MNRQSSAKQKWLAVILLPLCVNVHAAVETTAADTAFTSQKWLEAAASYQELSQMDAANETYWYRLGRSRVELQEYLQAIEPLQRALALGIDGQLRTAALLSLARAQAAIGEEAAAVNTLAEIAQTPARPYTYIKNTNEFKNLKSKEFIAVLQSLMPCNDDFHRAFDFWVGDWRVTTPSRPDWEAASAITKGIDGCSIHETYTSQGGYAGHSINFYDRTDGKWHQTWIDNQGAPLYLEGGLVDGRMVMADTVNRITWSVEPGDRVRQLWETTSDSGQTWEIAFDGYYARK